jgi:hypothetical protein
VSGGVPAGFFYDQTEHDCEVVDTRRCKPRPRRRELPEIYCLLRSVRFIASYGGNLSLPTGETDRYSLKVIWHETGLGNEARNKREIGFGPESRGDFWDIAATAT